MKYNIFLDDSPVRVPGTILSAYEIWAEEGGRTLGKGLGRDGKLPADASYSVEQDLEASEIHSKASWGSRTARLYAMELIKKRRLIRFPAHIPHQIPDRQRLAVVIALIKAAAQLRQHIALLLCLNIFCQDAQVKALGHSYNA